MNGGHRTGNFSTKSLFRLAVIAFVLTLAGQTPAWASNANTSPSAAPANQQKSLVVSGKVVDKEGNPLLSVNVAEKGTTNGVYTDPDGNFKISVKSAKSVLVFSFVGYAKQEVTVENQTNLRIELKEDAKLVDEVVVIGYGTQRKADVTSAVSSVKSKDFLIGKMQDAGELIKGKVAGLTITKSSGDPNTSSSILLRGISTLIGNTAPLVLIDGVPGDLTTVAPENIESIDVLKDASAAAIYGTRGANGVIIITTKSGHRNQNVQVTYSGYVSTSDFLKQADFMTPSDIRKGLTSFSDGGWDTDWVKAVTRRGFTNNHSLSINGGTKSSAYSANVSYRKENGTIKKSDNEEYKMQFDFTQYFMNDMLKVNLNLLKGLHTNSANNANDDGATNIYRQAVIHNPTSPIYDPQTGKYYEEFGRFQYYNPVAMINELVGDYKSEWSHMTGNLTFEPIKNWQTNAMISTQRSNGNTSTYTTSEYYTSKTSGRSGAAYKSYGSSKRDNFEVTSRYEATVFDDHHFSLLGGYSYSYEEYDGFSASNSDFPTDSYLYNNIRQGAMLKDGKAGMDSYKNDNKLIGFFGRLSYGYKDRYNLLASIRREGSSKFGDNHKWGTFPSVSAGWTIKNEEFLKDIYWINNLKLRVGHGITGVIPSSSYLSLTTYNYDNSYGNFVNENGKWVAGLMVTQNPNPNLKWEKTSEWNIGLDFGFLENRISGSIDLYNKETSDLLYYYNVPVPPNLYSSTLANVGSMRNRGIEVVINAIPVKSKDFEWDMILTGSHNENKLLNLSNDLYETENYMNVAYAGDPISVPTHRVEVGRGMGYFWGLKSVGVTKDGLWLIENPKTGKSEVYSTSMNSDEYRQYLGNGFPKFYMGFNNTFHYKNFDLGIQMSGQFGFKILNQQRMFYENNSIQYNRLRSAADLVYGTAKLSGSQAQAFVSYYLEDGDFVKFDNVTLGYNFKVARLAKYFSSARVYLSGQNLFYITGYKGLDPELANNDFMGAGNDFRDKYPTIRSFTFGLNITF